MDLLVSEVPPGWLLLAAFVFGAIWGSFFNVAIYRWPRDMSVVRPPSTCPHCGVRVPARFNLPIVGYFLLRGRAACCGAPLSPRYPIVELLSAVLCVAVVERFVIGAPEHASLLQALLSGVAYFWFVGGLVIATFVDLEFMEIPDEVSLPGAALGLATAVFRDEPGAAAAALGAGGGYLIVQLLFVWSYEHLLGRRGMGEGDSKLLMMIGAFVGWQGALFAVFAGAAQGLLTYLLARITGATFGSSAPGLPPLAAPGAHPEHPSEADAAFDASARQPGAEADDEEPAPSYWGHFKLPFGPFLALGALEYLFFGDAAVNAWLDLVQRGG